VSWNEASVPWSQMVTSEALVFNLLNLLRRRLWLYPQREEEKHAASDIIDGEGRTIEERLAALERIAYSWYCRAVLGCRKRAPFDKYCALLGETVQELFSIDIAAAFTDRYGTSPGVIPRGFTDLPETGRNRERW
jgi:hypothetical protein